MILVVIGIVPMIIVENGIVKSYEDRAVKVRSITVKNQCDIICDQMVQQNYLQDQSSTVINGELSILNNIYGGRILIIDKDFRIVKDTYDLDRGKTMVSQEVIDSYNGKDTSRYDSKSSYIEMTIRIQDKENKETLGVMLASVSTDEIKANMQILEQKGTMLLLIVMVFVLVLGYFLSGILVRPFQKVTRSIEDITDGFLDENISVPDYLETELITDAFNKMLVRVRTLDESRQEFVSNVSHELKTPLASMKVLADSLNAQEGVPAELYKEFMQDITEEIDRENQIITDLLSLVKMDKKAADLNIRSMNINDLLELILKRLSTTVINGELSILNNIYGGRILIIDKDFRIVKDTYDLDRGKTMVSQEVIDSYNGKDTSRYDSKSSYIEMTIRIQDKENKETLGVMLASVSTDEIKANMQILEQKGTMLLLIVMVFVLVLGYFLSGILVRPFQKVTRSIEDITDGFLDENISVPDYLETELITDAFNKMLVRVRTLDESRQEFVSNVSHELKTPLASMKVLADSLNAQEGVPAELYKEFMQDITEEIDRENQIITDLLSLVKMDKKAADLNIRSMNINDLLELILKRLRPIAASRNVELILDSFRPVNAEVDETKLTLAISNLVENGIKYNVEGGWVKVSLNADHKYFYVTVADSGMGIPKESLDHIFERFYRVDKSHSREIGGTGLGLAIARSAIVMHRGAIKVYSKENEGTTFSVRIPLIYLT